MVQDESGTWKKNLGSTIASECEQMDADTFARERLGWWSPILENKEEYAIDKDAWNKCISDESKPEGKQHMELNSRLMEPRCVYAVL